MDIMVSLSKELLNYIQSRIDSGDYSSSSAVIEDALLLLEQSEASSNIEELRRAWQEGKDSGDFVPLDADGMKREGRVRLAKRA